MIVPAAIEKVVIGVSGFDIFTPSEKLVKAWYENTYPKPDFPYWAKIWPAALALSEYIENNKTFFKGKKLVELGAGLGLPSLVAANYAASVLITDYLPEPLNYVLNTIKHHQYTNCGTAICNWKNIAELPDADILLLSDINYAPDDFTDMINVIEFYLKKEITIFLATPQRIAGRDFINAIEKYVKQVITKSIKIEEEEIAISIFIM